MKFKELLSYLKTALMKFFKRKAVKAVIKRLLGSSVAGGFWGFIITYIVEELFEEIAEPIIKLAFRKLGWVYDRVSGEIILKKIDQARADNDVDNYRINIGRV